MQNILYSINGYMKYISNYFDLILIQNIQDLFQIHLHCKEPNYLIYINLLNTLDNNKFDERYINDSKSPLSICTSKLLCNYGFNKFKSITNNLSNLPILVNTKNNKLLDPSRYILSSPIHYFKVKHIVV